jgi:hypothetical protein
MCDDGTGLVAAHDCVVRLGVRYGVPANLDRVLDRARRNADVPWRFRPDVLGHMQQQGDTGDRANEFAAPVGHTAQLPLARQLRLDLFLEGRKALARRRPQFDDPLGGLAVVIFIKS